MLIALLIVQIVSLVFLFVLMFRMTKTNAADPAVKHDLDQLKSILELVDKNLKDDMHRTRTELLNLTQQNRDEMARSITLLSETLKTDALSSRDELRNSINLLSETLKKDAQISREQQGKSLESFTSSISNRLQELTTTQMTQYETLKQSIETKLTQIQTNNEQKLEQMRQTVDEKLQSTLEKRLGESFKQVSERLEQVHKGLGEMQSLANGVGDLKRVLSNVKTRGVMGEIQLENLLEQILTPDQYVKNFKPNSRRDEIVEFAICLPAKDEDEKYIYLPIDAKFPVEDYHRLTLAYEAVDLPAIETAQKALLRRIRDCAKDIRDKYLNPPTTTDFALLFLPFEGLYAEVLRTPGIFETMQRDYHVIIVGPTTIAAILNSFQLGFRTLAIEKRSSEVWRLLSSIKLEFGKFGEVLANTQKKLKQAGDVIDKAATRTRQIQRHLNKVQDLPEEDKASATSLLELEGFEPEEEEEDS
ncbi:MAG: DNA recombination protein RmuC [Candidatus Cloacimonadaceae bacterium]|nr:DNA recombination protein RmuC [Candidatus Cloacimonadaceae bacterium]